MRLLSTERVFWPHPLINHLKAIDEELLVHWLANCLLSYLGPGDCRQPPLAVNQQSINLLITDIHRIVEATSVEELYEIVTRWGDCHGHEWHHCLMKLLDTKWHLCHQLNSGMRTSALYGILSFLGYGQIADSRVGIVIEEYRRLLEITLLPPRWEYEKGYYEG